MADLAPIGGPAQQPHYSVDFQVEGGGRFSEIEAAISKLSGSDQDTALQLLENVQKAAGNALTKVKEQRSGSSIRKTTFMSSQHTINEEGIDKAQDSAEAVKTAEQELRAACDKVIAFHTAIKKKDGLMVEESPPRHSPALFQSQPVRVGESGAYPLDRDSYDPRDERRIKDFLDNLFGRSSAIRTYDGSNHDQIRDMTSQLTTAIVKLNSNYPGFSDIKSELSKELVRLEGLLPRGSIGSPQPTVLEAEMPINIDKMTLRLETIMEDFNPKSQLEESKAFERAQIRDDWSQKQLALQQLLKEITTAYPPASSGATTRPTTPNAIRELHRKIMTNKREVDLALLRANAEWNK